MYKISEELKENYLNNTISREVILRFPDDDFEIGSENIISESFELKNSIMDEQSFTLGGCIASEMKIKVFNINQSLQNKKIVVFLKIKYLSQLFPSNNIFPSNNLYPGFGNIENEYPLFLGYVESAKRDKQQRTIKEIIAYDKFYDASQRKANGENYNIISDYYTHGTQEIALNEFGNALLIGYSENEFVLNSNGVNAKSKLYFNDENLMKESEKTKDSILSLARAVFELKSAFGYIDESGNIKELEIYDKIKNQIVDETISAYMSLEVEEYITAPITRLDLIYNKDNFFVYSYSDSSIYEMENEITKWCSDVSNLARSFYVRSPNEEKSYLFNSIYCYRPYRIEVLNRWWINVGDYIQVNTGYADLQSFNSFVFSKTISGINSMRITLEAKGTQYLGKEVE